MAKASNDQPGTAVVKPFENLVAGKSSKWLAERALNIEDRHFDGSKTFVEYFP